MKYPNRRVRRTLGDFVQILWSGLYAFEETGLILFWLMLAISAFIFVDPWLEPEMALPMSQRLLLVLASMTLVVVYLFMAGFISEMKNRRRLAEIHSR